MNRPGDRRMNIKTTLTLFVLIGAAALLWWCGGPKLPPALDPRTPTSAVQSKGTSDLLAELKPEKITRIEVLAPRGITLLSRKADGVWGMPGNWPIRDAEVKALVDLLAGLRTRFEPQPINSDQDWAALGLDHPAVTVKLTADGEDHTLAFGEKKENSGDNRFSRETYLRLDKKTEAVRLTPGLIAALDKPTDYYQQRRLFQDEPVTKENSREKAKQLAAKSVRVAEKKSDGVHFELEHHDSTWELAEPVRDRVDAAAREALLAAVPDIWAEKFVPLDSSDSPSIVGLIRPRLLGDWASAVTDSFFATQGGLLVRAGLIEPERTITAKDDKGDTVSLQIGNVSGQRIKMVPAPPQPGMPPGMPQRMMPVREEYRFAKLQYNDQIFEIKADKLKDVFVALDTLRDSRVARFNSADARKVEIKHGGEDLVLEKDKDNWKLVKPLSAEADNSKVTDLLTKLSDLQARDKDILDKDDPKKYGFDKPEAVVTVTVEEEVKGDDRRDAAPADKKEKRTRTLTVRIGKHDTDKKKLYVMADDWPRINIVDDSLEPLVRRSALAYRGKRLLDFDAASVARMEIDNQGQKIILEHDKDGWRLTAPAKGEAELLKVDQLLTNLGHLEAAEFVNQEPKQDELEARYGLGKPPLTARIEFSDKKKPAQVLHVGKARGGKEGYFARLAEGGPVFAINEELYKQLARDSLSYRPQTLWQLLPEEIESLRVHKAGQKEYTLTRSDKDWKISGPFEANALADAVQKMTSELSSPKVESYTAHEAKDLAQYGLDKPALTVAIKTVLGKDDKENALLIGKPVAKEGGPRYAKRANETAIFTIGEALVRAADRAAVDLLDTKLLHLDSAKVERLRSQVGDKSLTLEKKGEGWQVAESPAGAYAADTEAATSLSLVWSDLRAQRFADYGKAVEWAKYGLDKPSVRVTLNADKAEHVIELGKEVEGDPGARYARVDKGVGVAVLPVEVTRLLERTYLDYVNHDLLNFDHDAAASLQRHMGAKVLEVVRSQAEAGNETAGWQVVKPAKEKADDQAMRHLFEQLGHLRADRIAAYPVKDLQSFGLETPSALLTIKLKGDRKPAEHIIKLGKPAGKEGQRFALVDTGKTVAVLSAALVEQLTGSPLTFRDRTIARFGNADRLELQRGPRKAVFRDVEGSWKLIEPLKGDTEQDQLEDLLGRLARLRADTLVAEKPDADALKKYGLDHPEASWRVQSGDKEMLNLLVGNKEAKGGRRYAKLARGNLVFLLDPRLSQKVLEEYRPRTVWTTPLDALQIESLNYRYQRNPFLLEKAGTAWQTVGKPDAKINAATVEDTLAALAGLKLSRYAVDKGANLALFGLDKPELILEVATRSGKRLLHVGNVEGNSKGRYARVPDGDRSDVFVLDEETCVRLMRDLNAFGRPPARSTIPPAAR
jgi:hypothetical protein